MKKTIITAYAENKDITFIMEHIETDNGDPIQTAVIGWYHGTPNDENTRQYSGDLIAYYK